MSSLKEKLDKLKLLEAEKKKLLREIRECKELNKARVALFEDSYLKRTKHRTKEIEKANQIRSKKK
jgi:hypothetical protein